MLCCSATLRCEPGTGKMTAVICTHHVRKRPNSDFGTAAGEEEDCRLGLVSKSDGCCVQDLVQQRGRFCSSQQSRIDEFMQFVNQQRLKRKQVNMHHLLHEALNCTQDKQHDSTIVLLQQASANAQISCYIAVVVPASTSLSCQWCDDFMSVRQLLNVLNFGWCQCRDLVVQRSNCKGIQQHLRMPGRSGAEPPSLPGAKLGLAVIIRLKHGWDDTLPYARSAKF